MWPGSDPADKQVMRLKAKLAVRFKMAGGLLVNLRPGAAFLMEQTRMAEGVWLPRLAQINRSVKVLLFGGGDFNKTIEWTDYKHFGGDAKDFKIEPPKSDGLNTESPTIKKPLPTCDFASFRAERLCLSDNILFE